MSKDLKFNELFNKEVPDSLLAKKHSELLRAGKILEKYFSADLFSEKEIKRMFVLARLKLIFLKQTTLEDPETKLQKPHWLAVYLEPEGKIQSKQLEEAYKLKGHYEPSETRHIFENQSDEELVARAKELLAGINGNSQGTENEE